MGLLGSVGQVESKSHVCNQALRASLLGHKLTVSNYLGSFEFQSRESADLKTLIFEIVSEFFLCPCVDINNRVHMFLGNTELKQLLGVS